VCSSDLESSLADDPVFGSINFLRFTKKSSKSILARFIDVGFSIVIYPVPLKRVYERVILYWSESRAHKGAEHLVHVDMLIHSYAETQKKDRFIWKQCGHASNAIAQNFNLKIDDPMPILHFNAQEEESIRVLLEKNGLSQGQYIVVEPDTNRDWFGELRAWPFDRWQEMLEFLRQEHPDLNFVQIGVKDACKLDGVIDLRGQTNFKLAALVQRDAALFVGTEGGLMHAAAAVKVPSVILWGGVTVPEFAGYPKHHKIICKYVPCAPCGHLGWCDNNHVCMNSISVSEVVTAVLESVCASAYPCGDKMN